MFLKCRYVPCVVSFAEAERAVVDRQAFTYLCSVACVMVPTVRVFLEFTEVLPSFFTEPMCSSLLSVSTEILKYGLILLLEEKSIRNLSAAKQLLASKEFSNHCLYIFVFLF